MKYAVFLLFLIFFTHHGSAQVDKSWRDVFGFRSHETVDSSFLLLKLKEPLSAETLAGKGIQVIRQLSHKEYIIKKIIAGSAEIDFVIPANANWKLSPLLLQQLEIHNKQSEVLSRFYVYTAQPAALKKVLEQLKDQQLKIEYSSPAFIVISTTFEKLKSIILPIETVVFIESAERKAREEMALHRLDLVTNKVNLLHSELPLLNGSGMTVSIKEQKPDTTDIDLKGRYVSAGTSATSVSSHATIMATIIAGAGNSYLTGKGVASSSRFTSSSFSRLLPDLEAEYRKDSISVQNHSYGTGIENYYGADAMAYDQSTVSIPSLLHVFSSGNAGQTTSSTGAYSGVAGYANITGSFKMSKNSLSIGALDSLKNISLLSSKGPAHDGRLKPELVAIGEDGSSGAAAIVSGVALLCQQAYKEKHNGSLPDASLVKAVLINSADDIAEKGIDFTSGFGNVNAYRAVKTINDGNFFSSEISGNQLKRFQLIIPAGSKKLKITLCWTDPPSPANAFRALINDLDVELVNLTTNDTLKPWILNSMAFPDSLQQVPRRMRDSLNNVEQVTTDEAGGVYEIVVTGHQLKSNQRFYITYQWDEPDYFKWTFPSASDNMLPGTHAMVYWETALIGTGEIYYSGNRGNSWHLIASGVNLTDKQMRVLIPDSFNIGLMKLVTSRTSYTTGAFMVSAPLALSVGFNCPDSVQWLWNPIKNKDYILYQLGDRYLEPAGFYKDNMATIFKSAHPSLHFAVAPVLDPDRTGVKSYALNYTNQGVGCYLIYFIANKEENRSVLQFSLSSLFNVRRIELEKFKGGSYQAIITFNSSGGYDYQAYDSLLTAGVNTYRVKIIFSDGRVIYSDPEVVYHFPVSEFIVFPNPVSRNQYLNFLSSDTDGAMVRFYSMDGRKLLQKSLNESPQKIQIPFSPGIYIVEIIKEGKRNDVRKLIVN